MASNTAKIEGGNGNTVIQGPVTIIHPDNNNSTDDNPLKEEIQKLKDDNKYTVEIADYLEGNFKYNQLFTKSIIKAIRNDCASQFPRISEVIDNDAWCKRQSSMSFISNCFGFIGKLLYQLIAIVQDEETKDDIKQKNYVEHCQYIVKKSIDLTVFAFISQLWDDVLKQKVNLPDRKSFKGCFTMELNILKKFSLLRSLIQIYKNQNTDDSILYIPDVLKIADQFEEKSELCTACVDLEKIGSKPTILDCYFAEKHLTVFFEKFHFLVNYKVTSMKKIEFFNIKNINAGYLHHYVHLGFNRKSDEAEKEVRKFDNCTEISSLFTNAVLLYKGNDYTKNINLFPFVIDYNALVLEKGSNIAFFLQSDLYGDSLEYMYLEKKTPYIVEYNGIIEKRNNENVVFLNDEDMIKYNKDCVIDTYRKFEEKLF